MKNNLKKIILEELLKVLEEQTSQIFYANSKYAKLRDGVSSSSKVLKTLTLQFPILKEEGSILNNLTTNITYLFLIIQSIYKINLIKTIPYTI